VATETDMEVQRTTNDFCENEAQTTIPIEDLARVEANQLL
jgi:hypothetical protein